MNGFGGILATGYLMENMGTFFHIKLWRQAMTEKLNNDRITPACCHTTPSLAKENCV